MMTFIVRLIRKDIYWVALFTIVFLMRLLLPIVLGVNPITLKEEFDIVAHLFFRILIGSFPFLLIGTLASAVFEIYFKDYQIQEKIRTNKIFCGLTGVVLGFFTPLGNCGSIPFVGKLAERRWPIAAVVGYFLSTPLINPVGLAVMFVLIKDVQLFLLTIILTLAVSVATGVVIASASQSEQDIFMKYPLDGNNTDEYLALINEPELRINRIRQTAILSVKGIFQFGRLFVLGSIFSALVWMVISSIGITSETTLNNFYPLFLGNATTGGTNSGMNFSVSLQNGIILTILVLSNMLHIQRLVMAAGVFRKQAIAAIILVSVSLTLLFNLLWIGFTRV